MDERPYSPLVHPFICVYGEMSNMATPVNRGSSIISQLIGFFLRQGAVLNLAFEERLLFPFTEKRRTLQFFKLLHEFLKLFLFYADFLFKNGNLLGAYLVAAPPDSLCCLFHDIFFFH